MTSLLSSLLRLPRRGLATAAVASKHLLAQASRNRGGPRGRHRQETTGGASRVGGVFGLSAFSLFTCEAAEEEEKEGKEGKLEASAEDAIVLLLKKAKLSIMKGELGEAEHILHEAAQLSHKSDNKAAIIYTYNTMANLAFMRGHLDQAEKLFKATMSYLLAGDVKPDNNAILEMSLKLASIYAAQNREKLALAGYEFCILTLEEKVAREKEMPVNALPEEEKLNTHLLLAMSLDSFARYLLAHGQAAQAQAQGMYERALQISVEFQGETHPQTVVVMSDLATALDAQGRYEDAYIQLRRAVELARQTEHPEAHIILNNLAGILMHKEDYSQARQVYQEALERAEKSKDGVSARYIKAELAGLARRKKMQSKARAGLPEENGSKAGAEGE